MPAEAALTRLVLRWRPGVDAAGAAAGPVAFFSLEFSGALGSRAQRENRFAEVMRDPPSARDSEFAFQHIVAGLEPDTTYVFRLRAFNGVGPGPYAWRRLATPPARPSTPVPVRVGARSAVLRWGVPEALARRAAAVRRTFDEATAVDVTATKLGALPPHTAHRATWLHVLGTTRHRATREWLRRARVPRTAAAHICAGGLSHGGSARPSLLDVLEASDRDVVDWAWVRDHLAAGEDAGRGETRGSAATGEATQLARCALEAAAAGGRPATAEARRVQRLARRLRGPIGSGVDVPQEGAPCGIENHRRRRQRHTSSSDVFLRRAMSGRRSCALASARPPSTVTMRRVATTHIRRPEAAPVRVWTRSWYSRRVCRASVRIAALFGVE